MESVSNRALANGNRDSRRTYLKTENGLGIRCRAILTSDRLSSFQRPSLWPRTQKKKRLKP